MHEALARVVGSSLTLRLAELDDADYVFSLRTNAAYNKYLSEVSGTVEDQRRWIESYKTREAAFEEFYYVIERKDGRPCGVVRLYNITADAFTWGSWILDHNKPPKAALESAVLSFGIGFECLERSLAHVDVRIANQQALAFYVRFGMTEISRDDRDIYFAYERDRFVADRAAYMKILQGACEA